MAGSPAGEPPIFGAVLERRRSRWPLWVAAAAAFVTAGTLFARTTRRTFPVVTPFGVRQFQPGMAGADVQALMGAGPIGTTRSDDGHDCVTYGHPSLKVPFFTLYDACFQDGKLVRVDERKLSAQSVDPEALKRWVEGQAPKVERP